MVNWASFQTNIINFLSNQESSNSMSDTADFFASEYDFAMQTATTLLGNTVTGGTNKSALKSAFETAYTMQLNSPTTLSIAPYTIIAGGVVAYWVGAQFSAAPPHPPCVSPTVGITLLIPGLPVPLNAALMGAFNIGLTIPEVTAAASTIAGLLVTAFTAHLMTMTGLFTGLIPSSAGPVPGPPIPWVGVI